MASLILELDNVDTLPDGGPTRFEVRGGRSVDIGRDTYLDWTLPDPERVVSGRHCEISFRDGGYWITDVSTNGTYLNGSDKRLSETWRLKSGDRLEIGPYLINVTVEEDGAAASSAPTPAARHGQPAASTDQLWDVAPGAAPPPDPSLRRAPRQEAPVQPDLMEWRVDLPSVEGVPEPSAPIPAPRTPRAAPPADAWSAPPTGPGSADAAKPSVGAPDAWSTPGDAGAQPLGAGSPSMADVWSGAPQADGANDPWSGTPQPSGPGPAPARPPHDADAGRATRERLGSGLALSGETGGAQSTGADPAMAARPHPADPGQADAPSKAERSDKPAAGPGTFGDPAMAPAPAPAASDRASSPGPGARDDPLAGGDPAADGREPAGGPAASWPSHPDPAATSNRADAASAAPGFRVPTPASQFAPPIAADRPAADPSAEERQRASTQGSAAAESVARADAPGGSAQPSAQGPASAPPASSASAAPDGPTGRTMFDLEGNPHRPSDDQPFAVPPGVLSREGQKRPQTIPPAGATSAKPAAQPAHDSDAYERLLNVLARELGVPRGQLAEREPEELAEKLAVFMRLTVEGLQGLLKARAASRGYMRAGSATMVQAVDNNPIKFLPTAQDTMRTLLGPESRSYLGIEATLAESFKDVGVHQVALYAAMQEAITRLFRDLSPDTIEGEEERGTLGRLVGNRKAKLWDTYRERYAARTAHHDNGMIDAFLLCFAEAYQQVLDKQSR